MDGNKRTGLFALQSLLRYGGKEIVTTEDELYDFLTDIASGKMDYAAILEWIQKRAVSL
jgi:death-on-curing protein